MGRIILRSALLLMVIASVSTISMGQSTKAKYAASEAKLSVTFPAKFETSEEVKEDYRSVKTQTTAEDVVYFVSYTVHNNVITDTDDLVKISVDGFIDALNGTIQDESDWMVRKKRGLKVQFDVTDGGYKGEYRVVIIDQIQYQIAVLAPEANWDEKKTKKFFKSVKVKK